LDLERYERLQSLCVSCLLDLLANYQPLPLSFRAGSGLAKEIVAVPTK
jgi:hypothetical protein